MKLAKNIIIIFFLLFLTVPDRLFAQTGNIQLGNLKIIPSVTAQTIADNNIYMKNGSDEGANKKVGDWILHTTPGIMLNYTIPERGRINLGYQGDWAFYNQNTANDWNSQKAIFSADYEAPGGLILGIDNTWMFSQDPYGSPDQYAVGRITKRTTDDLKSKAGYNFSKVFKVLLFYNFYKQDYNDIADFTQNYTNNEFGLGLESRILSRTWAFVRYHYGQTTYNDFYFGLTPDYNSDSKYHRVNAGFKWDPSAKINGELNFGYLWKRYKNEFTDAAHSASREDLNTWIASTAVIYKPFTTTVLTLSIDRSIRDTNAGTSEYFIDTGFGLSLKQTILTKLVLSIGGLYSKNAYNLPADNNRKDDNYTFTAGLDYNIQKWLTVGVSYKNARKDSNFAVNEYRDEQGLATLKITY
jgi:hypothetical protein